MRCWQIFMVIVFSVLIITPLEARRTIDDKKVKNLLVVEAAINYILAEEGVQEQIRKIEKEKKYQESIDKIAVSLGKNNRSSGSKQKVINILNGAGNRINNLIGN